MKPGIPALLCIAMLAGGLFLALAPNRGNLNYIMPDAVRKWVNDDHDEEENLIAFTLLGSCVLCFGRRAERRIAAAAPKVLRLLGSRAVRMAALMAMVCVIELVQMFIPGRVADLNDVCTGWSGILAGWLLSVLLDSREEDSLDVKLRRG